METKNGSAFDEKDVLRIEEAVNSMTDVIQNCNSYIYGEVAGTSNTLDYRLTASINTSFSLD